VSDTSGVVATKLIDGLIAGKKDLVQIIESTYHKKLKASKEEIVKALTGRVAEHHKFMLGQIKKHMAF
jgi:transposase